MPGKEAESVDAQTSFHLSKVAPTDGRQRNIVGDNPVDLTRDQPPAPPITDLLELAPSRCLQFFDFSCRGWYR